MAKLNKNGSKFTNSLAAYAQCVCSCTCTCSCASGNQAQSATNNTQKFSSASIVDQAKSRGNVIHK